MKRIPEERIFTHSGREIWPADIRAGEVDIRDVAWSLSNQCRWTGHTRKFYSIAQHSVRVMKVIKQAGHNSACQLRGLIHDAWEAFGGDLNRPLKHNKKMKAYRDFDFAGSQIINYEFNLCPHQEQSAVVKNADDSVLRQEAMELMPEACYAAVSHLGDFQVNWESPHGHKVSYFRFLYHFYRLQLEMSGETGVLLYAKAIFRCFRGTGR